MSYPELVRVLSDMAMPFLYTHSPGQLHYTFAYFLCGSTCQRKSGEPDRKSAG